MGTIESMLEEKSLEQEHRRNEHMKRAGAMALNRSKVLDRFAKKLFDFAQSPTSSFELALYWFVGFGLWHSPLHYGRAADAPLPRISQRCWQGPRQYHHRLRAAGIARRRRTAGSRRGDQGRRLRRQSRRSAGSAGRAERARPALEKAAKNHGQFLAAGYVHVAGFAPLDPRNGIWEK